ncbi:DNA-3-methyladenine glycosylase I [Phaeobacter sp.]|uniref:DNA-3-methyladenine glycosylase I n=1 Tax=Phaeobacter sp. TaxID=1902409 RepID=UPI0025CC34D8|nr:DNA-3-methyladenine glycosylase I [Phaeobacter sp.]
MVDGFIAPDGHMRCRWAGAVAEFLLYHDTEWGFPVADDRRLFEKICLESFQSGLSWRTILAKRDRFRIVFDGFDWTRIAHYGESDVERLLQDAGIVRHRGKIEAVINNAQRAVEMVEQEGSLAAFFWQFEPGPDEQVPPQTVSVTPQSIALSKALKKRGWSFVGPTTAFAFMQAMGLVNDHAEGCICRPQAAAARAAFTSPAR